MTTWWKSARFQSLGVLVVGLLLTVLALQLGHVAGWDAHYVFFESSARLAAWLVVGACLVLGSVVTILGAVWVVFAAPAVRVTRRRAALVFCAALAFALGAVLTGVFAEWDMLAPIGGSGRKAPAWFLIVLCLFLAVPGSIAAVRSFILGPKPITKPHVWGAKPLFDENGNRIHYDED